MSKIYIQPPDHESFNDFLKYAEKYRYNLEIATFAYSYVLDTNWRELLEYYKKKLHGFAGAISIHGVFQDINIHSRDEKISRLSKARIIHNLEIAKRLNAKYIIFHSNFNPLITQQKYRENWVEQNINFWREIIKNYQITVLIENLWEPTPEILREMLHEVKSPRLRMCFDTGHANIFSKISMREWFDILGEYIAYIHVNDNDGDEDNELEPGEGTINWRVVSDSINELNLRPEIVFEVGSLEKTERAVSFFRRNGIYPF